MANIRSYPTATAKSSDSILGTSTPLPNTNDNPKTVNFSVSDVIALVPFTSLTTTGASGDAATLVSGVLNIPTPVIPFTGLTTFGSAGSAFLSPEGILNIPTPNPPQTITLTTNGTSGASTLAGGVLNVPNYATGVQSVVAGTNVTVDNNDPANPIINAAGGGGGGGITGSGTIGSLPIWTGTSELGDSFLQKGSTVDSLQTSNATASGTSSIAFGQDAQAISSSSIAIGIDSLADTGTSPIALGYQAKARADFTVSIGYNTESTGQRSTAIGAESQAYALSSTAIGRARVDATADYSVAIGVGSSRPVASGVQSIIIGEAGEASGSISMIFGYFSTATGQGSKVIAGNSASATGNYAVCSGSNTEAHDAYETVFGIFNKISTGSQTTRPFSPPNNIFVVGNGSSVANRSNALELNDDGELTLPFYASTLIKTGLAVEINTGKIITADAPNYTSGQIIIGSSGAGFNIDVSLRGVLFITWSGIDGDFDMMLPDANLSFNYYRKFKFVLSSIFSGGGKNVIITPNVGQTINGAASFTIPSNSYNVVEIWNRGGEWIITSKLIN